MNIILQILTVPLLASVWGEERFGTWILLTAVPVYFALTDLGFVQAATSDMTLSCARGDRKAALATFQSTWILLAGGSLVIVSFSSFLLMAVDFH